jgi:hypothetical protein
MADEVVAPIEEAVPETPAPTEATQEELPLAAATEEAPEADKPIEAAAEKIEEKPAEEPKPDWKEKELKSKHRQLQDAKRREDELRAEIETQRALLAKFNQGKEEQPAVIPVSEIDRRVQEQIAQTRYNEQCNKVNEDGKKLEGWDNAVENLSLVGGFDQATMSGVLATDDPAKVIYELGKNPDRYHQIMQMPLERRILEMGKIAMTPSSTKPVSNAPAPVSPVGGRAAPAAVTLRDEMPDETWFPIRERQKLERYYKRNPSLRSR